jgi:hypothetical protein
MPSFIDYSEIPGLELQQLAQIATHDGEIMYDVSWHAPSSVVYFYQLFKASNSRYWHSQQDDTIKESLNRFDMLTNASIQSAAINYAGGAYPAPVDFLTKTWSEFAARNEALSIDIVRDPTGDMAPIVVEYISPEELFAQ